MKHLKTLENYVSNDESPTTIEESILKIGQEMAESTIGYNGEEIDNIQDALTIIINDKLEDIDSSEIYDYFLSIMK